MTYWARSITYLVVGANLRGGPLPVLYQRFEAADTAIVGKATATRRIWNPSSFLETQPRESIYYKSAYACEVSIQVDAVIKAPSSASQSAPKAGAKISVIWYLPTRDCTLKVGDSTDLFNREALWLLRKEHSTLRVLVDYPFSFYPIENFTADIQRRLGGWSDPRSALTYLALKPGVLVPEPRYPGSTLPIQIRPLVSWTEYLNIFRTVYLESTEVQRGLISLKVSSIGYCLQSARRFAQSDDRFRSDSMFLNPGSERVWEMEYLSKMQGGTKDAIVRAFGGLKAAEDELIHLSCWSGDRVRAQARELLSKYFSIDPSKIPCIPCE